MPVTSEVTTSIRHQVWSLLEVGLDFVRREGDALSPAETNRVWSSIGPDGGFRNGRQETVTDLSTNQHAETLGISGLGRLRDEHLDVGISYTWSRREPTGLERAGARWSSRETRHHIHVLGTFTPTPYASFGLAYRYASGAPYNRFFFNDVAGRFEDYRSRAGVNPSQNVNDPGDDRPLLPSAQRLSLHVRLHALPLLGADFDVYADLLNVLIGPSSLGSHPDSTSFAQAPATAPSVSDAFETTTLGRRFFRLGIRYRY